MKYEDLLPLPSYCTDGLPWDLKNKKWQLNYLTDFQKMTNAGAVFPIFDLNLMSSDIGTEIGGLFKAHCLGIPIKYIELGNELYFSSLEKDEMYLNGYDYAETANFMWESIHSYFPDAKICINAARTVGTIIDKPNKWNNIDSGLEKYLDEQGGDVDFDALSHVYLDLELKPEFTNCDLNSYTGGEREDMLGYLFSTPFVLFDKMEVSVFPQKEFALLEEYSLEGWLTEFNQEDDYYNFRGRWAHGLFTALMALRALQTPGITKATCFDLVNGSARDVVLSSDQAIEGSKDCSVEPDKTSERWGLGAAGRALEYLGKATKNAHSTRQLFFGSSAPEIGDVTDEARPGIYGWIFSHSEDGLAYSAQDSNWAVILNLTGIDVPLKTSALFPFGGQAFVLFQKPDFHYDEGDGIFAPLGYIRGEDPAPELTELISALPTSPNGTVMLPAYSIVLLRSGNQVIIGARKAHRSHSKTAERPSRPVHHETPKARSRSSSPARPFKLHVNLDPRTQLARRIVEHKDVTTDLREHYGNRLWSSGPRQSSSVRAQ